MKTENEVFEESKRFSLRIIRLYKYLCNEKREFILSKQTLRSGTSIGANISEAMMAQSKADFIAKMQIALKECNETKYWLELLYRADYISADEYNSIDRDCCSLLRLLMSIVKTSKRHLDT